MRHISPSLYAKSFVEAAEGKRGGELEAAVERFLAIVHRNGDGKKLKNIFEECEKAARQRQGRSLLTIEAARKLPEHSLASLKKTFATAKTDVEESVNPELVAGVRLTMDGERQLDGSLLHVLNEIFG